MKFGLGMQPRYSPDTCLNGAVLSAAVNVILGAELILGTEMVMDGTEPLASVLFRKEDSDASL